MEFIARDPTLAERPYQLDALQAISQHQKCVKMFCGTGKSLSVRPVLYGVSFYRFGSIYRYQ